MPVYAKIDQDLIPAIMNILSRTSFRSLSFKFKSFGMMHPVSQILLAENIFANPDEQFKSSCDGSYLSFSFILCILLYMHMLIHFLQHNLNRDFL